MDDVDFPIGPRSREDRIRLSIVIGLLSGICVFVAVIAFYSWVHGSECSEDFWILPGALLEPPTAALAAALVGYRILSAPPPGLGAPLVACVVGFAVGAPYLAWGYAPGGPATPPEVPLSLIVGACAGALPPAVVAAYRRRVARARDLERERLGATGASP